ncbi:MAG: hypothetical protein RIQ52_1672 [Pseudomonadota bacterium]|jgi:hypothetical protein
MRYFVSGEHQRKMLLNAVVLMFLGYTILFWISNGLMYFHRMGLTADSVTSYYLGSEDLFTEPKSYGAMLEVTHFHLFAMGILVVTLAHLALFTPLSVRLKVMLVVSSYLSAVGDELSGWLVRFVHPLFAYVKIAAFLMLETSLAALIIAVSAALLQERLRSRQSTRS